MHHKQLKNFKVGDHVTFTLVLGKDGKPQAIDLEAPGAAGAAGAANSAGAVASGDRYAGTVKKFDQAKGFGFIECADLQQMYGRDVWVHHQQLNNFNVGDEVTFDMVLNKAGHPQAIDLDAAGSYGGAAKRRKM